MYLLNTREYTLHYFSEPHIPPYAILSHTWDKSEISFNDINDRKKDVEKTAAFSKIRGCCNQAWT